MIDGDLFGVMVDSFPPYYVDYIFLVRLDLRGKEGRGKEGERDIRVAIRRQTAV